MGEEPRAGSIIGANFTAGFVAGAVTGAATCPLDVAKTRRQIEVKKHITNFIFSNSTEVVFGFFNQTNIETVLFCFFFFFAEE